MRRRYYDDENLPKEGEGNQQFTGVIPGRSEDQRKPEQSMSSLSEEALARVGQQRKQEEDARQNDMRKREVQLLKKKKFVRYAEGAKLYSIGEELFAKLALESHAVYKINHICLVSTEIFEEDLEAFRV